MNPRILLALLVALALGLLAGCGGGDDDGGGGEEADSGTDATQLLEETFTGKKEINSGKLDLAFNITAEGEQPVSVKLGGPFQNQGASKVPQLDIDLKAEAQGQSIEAGITSTGEAGFVNYNGTEYEIAGPVWQQFVAGYEQAAKQGQAEDQSLASLGLNPRNWLTDPQNAGEAKVGDTDTIKITGGVDVPKLLDDVDTALGKVRSLGGAGAADVPDKLTAEQRQQIEDAIKNLDVEIYTGAEDKILRRLVIDSTIESEGQTGDIKVDLQLLDLNEDQEIQAPDNPKPFEELAAQLEQLGLGGLGGLGGAGGGGGGGANSGGASQENLEKYTKCIEDAGSDQAEVRKCADLLTP